MTGKHWGYSPWWARVNGHARNRENRRQQHRENRSAHVATIGALDQTHLTVTIAFKTVVLRSTLLVFSNKARKNRTQSLDRPRQVGWLQRRQCSELVYTPA